MPVKRTIGFFYFLPFSFSFLHKAHNQLFKNLLKSRLKQTKALNSQKTLNHI